MNRLKAGAQAEHSDRVRCGRRHGRRRASGSGGAERRLRAVQEPARAGRHRNAGHGRDTVDDRRGRWPGHDPRRGQGRRGAARRRPAEDREGRRQGRRGCGGREGGRGRREGARAEGRRGEGRTASAHQRGAEEGARSPEQGRHPGPAAGRAEGGSGARSGGCPDRSAEGGTGEVRSAAARPGDQGRAPAGGAAAGSSERVRRHAGQHDDATRARGHRCAAGRPVRLECVPQAQDRRHRALQGNERRPAGELAVRRDRRPERRHRNEHVQLELHPGGLPARLQRSRSGRGSGRVHRVRPRRAGRGHPQGSAPPATRSPRRAAEAARDLRAPRRQGGVHGHRGGPEGAHRRDRRRLGQGASPWPHDGSGQPDVRRRADDGTGARPGDGVPPRPGHRHGSSVDADRRADRRTRPVRPHRELGHVVGHGIECASADAHGRRHADERHGDETPGHEDAGHDSRAGTGARGRTGRACADDAVPGNADGRRRARTRSRRRPPRTPTSARSTSTSGRRR